jgi:23S rRNA (uridine2552-2'-O)-methyltransferase
MKRQDLYYKLSKKEHYRSRAAYKLLQLDSRFFIFKKGQTVLELGSSPGGWSQVAVEKIGTDGFLVGVDLNPVKKLEGAVFIRHDIMDDGVINEILKVLESNERMERVQVLISDMAPHTSGNKSIDHVKSIALAERAWFLAANLLQKNGNMVLKVFNGDLLQSFRKELEKHFVFCKINVPDATREGSSEVYIICKKFKGVEEYHPAVLSP